MQLTHFGHSCLLVEIGDTRILIDPGTLASGWEPLTGLDAVLVTHQHPDHLDTGRFPALRAANPDAVLRCDPQTAAREGEPWQEMHPGDRFTIGDAEVSVQGGAHAIIHPDIPGIDNVALLIGTAADPGLLLHPGDSFHVPDEQVDVLALPVAAPWLKISESVDYVRAVTPRVAIPIHQGMLSTTAVVDMVVGNLKPEATTFQKLEPEVATSL